MAKFEEVLPALREDKKIRRKSFRENYFIDKNDCIIDIFETFEELLEHDDWEIVEEPKPKVKYYPGLYKKIFDREINYYLEGLFTKENQPCPNAGISLDCNPPICIQFVRLITEIPELIEERDE